MRPSLDPAFGREFVSLSDLMGKVGYFLLYWSTLEQALTDGILEARKRTGVPAGRISGTFKERVDNWWDLATVLPDNANKAALAEQIRRQAFCLRKIRNTIVHGLMSGHSMPLTPPAHIVCAVGGYDNQTGETLEYSIDDLEHFAQAADACRRGFQHIDNFNYRLDPRFQVD